MRPLTRWSRGVRPDEPLPHGGSRGHDIGRLTEVASPWRVLDGLHAWAGRRPPSTPPVLVVSEDVHKQASRRRHCRARLFGWTSRPYPGACPGQIRRPAPRKRAVLRGSHDHRQGVPPAGASRASRRAWHRGGSGPSCSASHRGASAFLGERRFIPSDLIRTIRIAPRASGSEPGRRPAPTICPDRLGHPQGRAWLPQTVAVLFGGDGLRYHASLRSAKP